MKTGPIGEALEIFQEETEKALKTAAAQITGKTAGQTHTKQTQQAAQGQASQNVNQQSPVADVTAGMSSESTSTNQPQDDSSKQFIADLYGGKTPSITEEEIQQKELEDKKKQEELRQKLHREYYEKLVNRPKPQQPRPQEKVEQEEEEKEKREALEEEKKKKEELSPIMTKNRGTAEKLRGVSG